MMKRNSSRDTNLPRTVINNWVFVVLLLLLAGSSCAETISFNCNKPSPKPNQFQNHAELQAYQTAVTDYQNCLKAIIDEQTEVAKHYQLAADAAREKANRAIAEWNTYVRNNQAQQGTKQNFEE